MDFSTPCNNFASLIGSICLDASIGSKEPLVILSPRDWCGNADIVEGYSFLLSLLCLADVIVTFEVSAFAWGLFETTVALLVDTLSFAM